MDDGTTNSGWIQKFANAFRGIGLAIRGQSSFFVHLWMAVAVISSAAFLRADPTEWCILILCIATVMAAEAFNSALESMAKAVDREYNENIGKALDMASGAVLLVSIAAAIVGLIVFIRRLM